VDAVFWRAFNDLLIALAEVYCRPNGEGAMDSWHATFLGLRHLPREVTAFEIEAFYQFSAEECRVIEERRRPELKLALALQIGFLRMSGRLLEAVRIVPPLLWKHLGARFNVAAPDLASLRAMYRRAPTLIEHQQLACETLGFRWLGEHHRRGLVRVMREELTRTDDPQRLLGFVRRWLYDHRLIIVHERRLRAMARHADTTARVRVQCAELVVVCAGQALDSTDRRDDRAHRGPVRFASS
jgi:hypothetical protein